MNPLGEGAENQKHLCQTSGVSSNLAIASDDLLRLPKADQLRDGPIA